MKQSASVLSGIKLYFYLIYNLNEVLCPIQIIHFIKIIDQVLQPLVLVRIRHNNIFCKAVLAIIHNNLLKVSEHINVIISLLRTAAPKTRTQLSGSNHSVHNAPIFLRISHPSFVVCCLHELLLLLAKVSLLSLLHLLKKQILFLHSPFCEQVIVLDFFSSFHSSFILKLLAASLNLSLQS